MVKNILPLGKNYKGIILESPRVTAYPEAIALLKKLNIPMINVAGFGKTAAAGLCPCVFPDCRQAFGAGFEHLP